MKGPLYFASGSSRAADIRGFSAIGHAIGVAAQEVSPASEAELVRLAGTGLQVFVDSGAFSEVAFSDKGVTVVKPITHADWQKRLALYLRLATVLGEQVYLVAPDRIGDQEETLRRLTRYAPELRVLRWLGARILVPIQKGTKTQAAFVRDVIAALGFDDFVHAIPAKKRATTLDEMRAYVREVRPRAIHFLGLGIRNTSAPAVLALCNELIPDAAVSCDSNMIAANVGRGRGLRPLSAAQDKARRMIARGATSITSVQELGIILAFGPQMGRAA